MKGQSMGLVVASNLSVEGRSGGNRIFP